MEEDKQELESVIRAIVQSEKSAMTVKKLERDYFELEKKPIPYRKFGCDSLEKFLNTFGTLIVYGNGPSATVRARGDSSSRHVTSLIEKQKSSKKKSFTPAPRRGRGNYHYQGPPRNYSAHKTAPFNNNKTYAPSEHRSYYTHDTQRYSTTEPRKYTPPVTQCNSRRGAISGSSSRRPADIPPRFQTNKPVEQLVVNIRDHERQVSYGDSSDDAKHMKTSEEKENIPKTKYNLPPRFQKPRPNPKTLSQSTEPPSDSQLEDLNSRLFPTLRMDEEPKNILPSLPSLHVAIGRAIQQAELLCQEAAYLPDESTPEIPSQARLHDNMEQYNRNNKGGYPNKQASLHIAFERAIKQAELLRQEAAYLPDVSIPEIPSQVQKPDFRGSALQNFSFNGFNAQVDKVPFQESLLDTISLSNGEAKLVTSSHQTAVSQSVVPDTINIQNNIGLLKSYCDSKSLPVPEYKSNCRRPEGGHIVMYTATVRVSGLDGKTKKHSSWPNENINEHVSKGFAALKALEEFQKEEELLKTMRRSTDESVICDRIYAMVVGTFTGIIARCIEDDYKLKHQEILPSNWISIAMNSPKLEVESIPTGHLISPKAKYIVSDSMVTPPKLKFPDPPLDPNGSETWDVFVTRASGPNDVSFRLIGEDYDQKLDELRERMESYYKLSVNKENPLMYECGRYYAACIMTDVLRVQVLEVMVDTRKVKVLLVDHGDTDTLSFDSLYPLNPEFVQLPCQAVSCSLEGLDDYDDFESKDLIASSEDLIGKALVAEIKHKDEIALRVTVVLFDTSDEVADVNINEKLLEALTLLRAVPSLVPPNKSMPVTVSSVSLEGEVYIQVPSPSLDQLNELTDSITPEQIERGKLTGYKDVKMQKIYLAKYSPNSLFFGWYRAVVIKPFSRTSDRITVQYIDFGNVNVIGISDLADICELPSTLRTMPYQALKVDIQGLPMQLMSPKDMARLSSLLVDREVLIKTIDLHCNPPLVHMEVDQDGTLTTISDALDSLRSLENEVNGELNGGLVLQLMPELENRDWQQMAITLCSNPTNFVLQFTKYVTERENLMQRMQFFYNILPAEAVNFEVVKNKTYACLYPDDQAWYRVIVTGVRDDSVSVCLCDFGDTNIVPKANIRQLVSEFCQTPFLAVKARLGGIHPRHGDWQVEDITKYAELVNKENIFGQVLSVERNEQDLSDSVAVVKLMDLNEKTYIDDIFVNEGRALRVPL